MAIYMRISRNSIIPSILFFLVCLSLLFFAYLAYTTFASNANLFTSCSKCCDDYAALKASCTPVQPVIQNHSANSDINITVPG